jgi:CubicO group peptidase (beta-lactamase class C family)
VEERAMQKRTSDRALRLAAALSFAALPPALAAQDTPADRLAAKVDRIFRPYARADGPGAVVLVGRGDQILLQRAYGQADLERGVPLAVDSVLDIGSTSKQFTAACVLLLAGEGKLSITDPVRKHVPELPACCDAVTVRHLLLHTSGIPDYIGLLVKAGAEIEDRTNADDAMDGLERVAALLFAPGHKWEYSNSNYFLLAEIVERAAHRPLAEFAAERIFEPLGMASTHVHADATQLVSRRALSYTRGRPGTWRWCFSNWEQTGDGAVFTTVGDLFRWSRNFTTGAVGGEKLLQAMAARGSLDDGTTIDYGMGLLFSEEKGEKTVSHSGAWAGYRADLLRIPERDLVVICLANRDDVNPSGLCLRVAAAARDL